MVKVYYAIAVIVAAFLFISWFAFGVVEINAQTFCYPLDGCTGTTTAPTAGQILVGQSDGTYGPKATTTLGFVGLDSLKGSSTQVAFFISSSSVSSSPEFVYIEGVGIIASGTIRFNTAALNSATTTYENIGIRVHNSGFFIGSSPINVGDKSYFTVYKGIALDDQLLAVIDPTAAGENFFVEVGGGDIKVDLRVNENLSAKAFIAPLNAVAGGLGRIKIEYVTGTTQGGVISVSRTSVLPLADTRDLIFDIDGVIKTQADIFANKFISTGGSVLSLESHLSNLEEMPT